MTTRSWIRRLFARMPCRAPHGGRPAPRRCRPTLDVLEDRLTPSSLGTAALLEGPAAGSASDLVYTSGAWSASANAPWLHTSATGTGNGLATLSYDANPGATRSGTLTIAGLTLTVTQAGSTYVPANPLTLVSGLGGNGVAVDGSGNVHFADSFNNAIKEWSASTQSVSTLVSSGLNFPTGVAVDGAGNVYFADSRNNAIKEWKASTQTVSTLVSSGLYYPTGVAVDGAGNVYFADSDFNAIKEWNASTQSVSTLVSSGLNFPLGVAVDGWGNVFFADTDNNAIKEWNASTQTVSTLVSSGLSYPTFVAVDGAGNVYFADSFNNAIKEWSASTQSVSTLVSSGLNYPLGVAVDGAGNVYFADEGHYAIKELPRAFVPGGAVSEGPAAGTDALPPVLPATQSLTGPFAPSSDQSWLTVDPIPSGAVHFFFTANSAGVPRTAHLSVLGQSISVTQQATPSFSNLGAPTTPYGAAPTTIAGQLGSGAPLPSGSVTITLAGVPQTASLNSDGSFSASFDTHALAVTPGGYPISFAYAGDSNYGSASASSTLTVTPATLTVTPGANQSKLYGAAVPALSYTVSGLVNNDPASTLTGALGTAATVASPVGSYAFTTGTLAAGSNYTVVLAANPPAFAVTPAPLSITPAAGQSKVYGAAVPPLSYTASGFVNGDPASTLTGALGTTATVASPVGSYAFTTGTLVAGSNYSVALAANPPTFAVTPAPLSASAVNVSATAGAPFSGTLASFTTAEQIDTAAAFTAVITWGDGSTSSGVVTGSNGSGSGSGSHTWAAAGSYAVRVWITNPNTQSATASDTATLTSLNQGVVKGLTGGIGFWDNSNGQTLLNSFNGGSSSTALGNWLAASFPTLYGASAGSNDLIGKSNAQVAAYFQTLFNLGGSKVQAQVLAVALNLYATTSSLGGNAAAAYGFTVSVVGLGAYSYNVGSDGAAFGVANNSTLDVYQLLLAVNNKAVNGVLYNGNTSLQTQCATLLGALDQAGSIS
jgi:sugar lactone lactonase YvrE